MAAARDAIRTLSELAQGLAAGEDPERLLAELPAESRALGRALTEAFTARLQALQQREDKLRSTLNELRMALRGYSRIKRELKQQYEELRAELEPARRVLIGADSGLREVMRVLDRVLDTPLPVLITGESGTGKEVLARYLHEHGPRADGPFVAINCAALPGELLESELFGIEEGVATGVQARRGRIEEAQGGTLLLDEIADMPAAAQAKLLRVLQEREVERVGGRRPINVDVRVVSATNKDPRAEIAAGRLREDLFFRIAGVHVHLPPLRERRQDIDALLAHFVADAARRFGRTARRFSPEALAAIHAYDWPGNVRELMLEVERAVALAEGPTIELEHLTPRVRAGAAGPAGASGPGTETAAGRPPEPRALGREFAPLREARRRFERSYVAQVLQSVGGARRRAAEVLGITREGLRKKLRALGLDEAGGDEDG
ncbi:MAG: hypothetical protein KatS3mg102_0890 [Planctomycetota bacterium]|nr:MAG: hypothetical protein KatS3mg102_0890 [Planctomycetota bacterium]